MMDLLLGDLHPSLGQIVSSGIVVSVVIREIAAGYLQPYPVVHQEPAGSGPHGYPVLHYSAGLEQLLAIPGVAMLGADCPLADVQRRACRDLVYEPAEEIRIPG